MKDLLVQTHDGTVLVDGVKLVKMMYSIESVFADIRAQLAEGEPYDVTAVTVNEQLISPFAVVASELDAVLTKREQDNREVENESAEVSEAIVALIEEEAANEPVIDEVEVVVTDDEDDRTLENASENDVDETNDSVDDVEEDETEPELVVEPRSVPGTYAGREWVEEELTEWSMFRSNGRDIQPKWSNLQTWTQKIEQTTGYQFIREDGKLKGLTDEELVIFRECIAQHFNAGTNNVLPLLVEAFAKKVQM